jgi:hypothetical protein
MRQLRSGKRPHAVKLNEISEKSIKEDESARLLAAKFWMGAARDWKLSLHWRA